jgi:hypothetical protein
VEDALHEPTGSDLGIVQEKGLLGHLLWAVSHRFFKWMRHQYWASMAYQLTDLCA